MSTRVRYCSIALRSASYPSLVSRGICSFTVQNTTIIHGTFWNLSNLRTVLANLSCRRSFLDHTRACTRYTHSFEFFFFVKSFVYVFIFEYSSSTPRPLSLLTKLKRSRFVYPVGFSCRRTFERGRRCYKSTELE